MDQPLKRDSIYQKNDKEKSYDRSQDNINNQTQLPLIDKRIYIHQPSDFLKNKYTLFGNLAHSKDILNKNSRKNYHSPKFDYNDINVQMQKGNKIIGSIIKEENNILPNLLKNYSVNFSDKNSTIKNTEYSNKYQGYNTTTINNLNFKKNESIKTKKKFRSDDTSARNISNMKGNMNNSRNNLSNINNNKSDFYNYKNNIRMINHKSERLVNLNFLVSSPKKVKANSNYNLNRNNYYQYIGTDTANNKLRNFKEFGYSGYAQSPEEIMMNNVNKTQGNYNMNFNRNYNSMDSTNRPSNFKMYKY